LITKVGLFRAFAAALVLAGVTLGGRAVYSYYHQQQVDAAQDSAWRQFEGAASGVAPSASPEAPGPTPSAALPTGIYLKMTLPSVAKDAVAVDGDWSSLKVDITVHYKTSAAPGQQGNMLIAFHREPRWLDINHAKAGDLIRIDTLDHKTFEYRIDFVKVVSATDVSYLKATSGRDLTLITCDPPYRDYDRMYFRAHLVPPG
jgi:LPXTG-site transpeptidase (sortase) family protein